MKRELPFAAAAAAVLTAGELRVRSVVRSATAAVEDPKGCAQRVADQVAQRGVTHALTDAVALAKPFDANDRITH